MRSLWNSARRFRWLTQEMGSRNAVLFTLCSAFRKNVPRSVDLPYLGGVSVWLRPSTPDLDVARAWFSGKECPDFSANDITVIIDAGAYTGISSIYFTTRYPKALVFAIEPEVENFKLLQRNCQQFDRIIPINAALWSNDQMRPLKERPTGAWGFTVADAIDPSAPTEQVINCLSMCTILVEYGLEKVDLLKLDIEGAEKDVMESSNDWIGSVKTIVAELHDRIIPGASRAFYLATRDFENFSMSGEKVIVSRKNLFDGPR